MVIHTRIRLRIVAEQTMVFALSIWLVLFAPLFCQFHGLLMDTHAKATTTHHHHVEVLCGEMAQPEPPAPGATLWKVHQTTPGTTVMASLYLLALPDNAAFAPASRPARLASVIFLPPLDPDLPVPKQPPRVL